MRKGNQVKIKGLYPSCGREGIIEWSWPKIYRHVTSEEVQEWRDSDASKGMNCAGETKLPPRCVRLSYEGGTRRVGQPGGGMEKNSDDTQKIISELRLELQKSQNAAAELRQSRDEIAAELKQSRDETAAESRQSPGGPAAEYQAQLDEVVALQELV